VLKRVWRLWALAMGEKATSNNREADAIAVMRTIVVLINLITACFITANILVGWGVISLS